MADKISYSDEQKADAYKMFKEGKTKTEIAKHFKTTIASVSAWINKGLTADGKLTKKASLMLTSTDMILGEFRNKNGSFKVLDTPKNRALLTEIILGF